jgi:hypothetical protein
MDPTLKQFNPTSLFKPHFYMFHYIILLRLKLSSLRFPDQHFITFLISITYATPSAHFFSVALMNLTIKVKNTNYEAPVYVIFSILLLLPLSWT